MCFLGDPTLPKNNNNLAVFFGFQFSLILSIKDIISQKKDLKKSKSTLIVLTDYL